MYPSLGLPFAKPDAKPFDVSKTFFGYAFLMPNNGAKGAGQSNLDLAFFVSTASSEKAVEQLVYLLAESSVQEIETDSIARGRRSTQASDLLRLSAIVKKHGVQVIRFNDGHHVQREAAKYVFAFAHYLPETHCIRRVNEDLVVGLERFNFNVHSDQMKDVFETVVRQMNNRFTILFTRVSFNLK